MTRTTPKLILASASPYRRELLQRLCDDFEVIPTGLDESPIPGESPAELAARLAKLKAKALAAEHPEAVLIGSDQVAALNGEALGKPGTHERAVAQLRACSAQSVEFFTAVCILSPGLRQEHIDHTSVRFKALTKKQIEAYLHKDKPYDCAGSFKVEKTGVLLFDAIVSDDPTGLVGLPLIWLGSALEKAGIRIL
jgi:septum formation protein